MDRRFLSLLFVLVLLSCSGGGHGRKDAAVDSLRQQEVSDITQEAYSWADSVSAQMSVERMAAQLLMPAVYASDDYWTIRRIAEYADMGVGGIVLLKGDIKGAAAVADSLLKFGDIPPFVAIDAEWGLAMRLSDAPEFPDNCSIAPDVDEETMYSYGRELARECRLIGVNMVLGPVLDVADNGGRMRRRSFGGDPGRVADLGIAYARGIEDGNVVSVAKHFPGLGSVAVDSHKSKGVVERSLQKMDSVDLYPFRRWVEQRLTGVMVGHLAVPSIDSRMLPAAVSPTVINGLLRNELGFRGLVITDAMNMGGASGYGSDMALKAGADIMLAPVDTKKEIDRIAEAVKRGEVSPGMLRERVRRILFYKYMVAHGAESRASESVPALGNSIADSLARSLCD